MKPLVIAAVAGAFVSQAGASVALAQSGCVGRVLLPPVESSRTERVLEAPGHVERSYVPARLERSVHRVLIRPTRIQRVRWAAQYRIERRLMLEPGPVHWMREPDRYADVAQNVLVSPGHYSWERRYGPLVSGPPQPGQTMVTPTGLVMCKVWCPARHQVVIHRVRIGRGRSIPVHALVRHEIDRRVLVRSAGSTIRRLPAEYRLVDTLRVVSPARWQVQRVAAQYGWRRVGETRDGGAVYAPVVCGGPLSRPAMARMQASLAARGYDPGATDGTGRPETYDALHRFQVDHRLAAGQVTVESARALGVVP